MKLILRTEANAMTSFISRRARPLVLVGLAVLMVVLAAVITPERLHRIGTTRHA